MITKFISLMLLISFGKVANAQYVSYTGNISDIGCHQVDGTCFATLAGVTIEYTGCANKGELRWDNADTENGKRSYASLLTAFMTDTKVQITVGGCTGQGYPALMFYHLQK